MAICDDGGGCDGSSNSSSSSSGGSISTAIEANRGLNTTNDTVRIAHIICRHRNTQNV